MRALATIAAAGAAAVLAGSCSSIGNGDYFGKLDQLEPGHLRYCNSGEPEFIDPALATSTTDVPIVEALFDGLADRGPDAEPVPGLAESWDFSPDMRRFTFHLREDAVWSNGRPIVADDFVYHIVRMLHPATASRKAEEHWNLKNGERFTSNRVKLVLADVGPFHRGDVVEVRGWQTSAEGELTAAGGEEPMPDSNVRTSTHVLALRDLGKGPGEAYFRARPGTEVTIVEQKGTMSYVFVPHGDGIYGWVPTAELDGQPNGTIVYSVREVPPEHRVGVTLPPDPDATLRTGKVPGRELLMTPDVLGVRAPDEHTLVLETWGPVPYMIEVIADPIFRPSPREAVSRWPLRWTQPEHIVTSGPFRLDSWTQRDKIELSRSPTYWNPELPKLDRLTIYSMDDQGASANTYYMGGCDAVSSNNIPTSYQPVLEGAKRGGKRFKDYVTAPYLGIYYYVFNTEKIDNRHLRRALSMAVARDPLPKVLHGGEIPSHQFTPGMPISGMTDAELALCGVSRTDAGVAMIVEPGKLCYVPPYGPGFDVEGARKELALAREELGSRFPEKLDLRYNAGSEGHKIIAEYIQHQWKVNLGLDAELSSQEWKTFLKDTAAGNYQIARMGWIGGFLDPEYNFLRNFTCKSPQNRSRWCSEEYDALIERIESTADRAERLRLSHQAEAMMLDAMPVLPLYVYTQRHLIKPYVKGLTINLTDNVLLQWARIDPDWKKEAR